MSPDDPDPGLPTSGHLLLTYEGETPPWPSVAAFLTAGLDDDRSDPGDGEIVPTHLVQALRAGLVDAVREGFGGLQVVGEAG